MSSYAVLWQNGNDQAYSGRLDLDHHGLWLRGGRHGEEIRTEIPYAEIDAVGYDHGDRIGACRAIRLRTHSADPMLIASFAGAGVLCEILDALRLAASRVAFERRPGS
jgi:hypothetical protein